MANITLSGHVFDATGAALSNKTITVRLANYLTIPYVSGSNLIVPTSVTTTSNASGFFSIVVIGNDAITPAKTIYEIQYDGDGEWIPYKFTGSSPINLDSFSPLSTPVVAAGPVPNNLLSSNNIFSGTNSFSGGLSVTGSITTTFGGAIKLGGVSTVANLPAASSNQDQVRIVTDASAPTYRGTVTGGGTARCLVYSDGTNWLTI